MKCIALEEKRCQPQRCDQGLCLARQSCPTKALWQEEPYTVPFLSAGQCNGCSKCIAACPFKAISLR